MTITRSHYSGNERSSSTSEKSEKPTTEEDLKISLCFDDTCIYDYDYQILVALKRKPLTSDEDYLYTRSRDYSVDVRKVTRYHRTSQYRFAT